MQKGHTPEGQQLALLFQREAQSILNYCISAGSQDPSLVAAAIVIATFEMQPHVEHTTDRLVAAVLMLDGIGLSVFSSRLDADDVRVSTSITGLPRLTHSNVLATTAREREVQLEPSITKWAQVPAWANHWSAGDIWKEEMRRMLWAASSISATLSLWLFMVGKSSYNLEISHPERVSLVMTSVSGFFYVLLMPWYLLSLGFFSPERWQSLRREMGSKVRQRHGLSIIVS